MKDTTRRLLSLGYPLRFVEKDAEQATKGVGL
jgi:hypothetical protein